MNILVVGQGGREHALVHAFAKSGHQVHALPGSEGMAPQAQCHNFSWRDFDSVTKICFENQIDFVFIGPEDPLVMGLSDHLRGRGLLVVGPSGQAAQLEGSKIFAKKFMTSAQVPTAEYSVVDSVDSTMEAAKHRKPPYVLKADGLAAGKGVFICRDLTDLKKNAEDLFTHQILGNAGLKALLEDFTPGWELSFLVITNGQQFSTLPLAQDHKRLLDNDDGPNTGGMGAVAPVHIDPQLLHRIENEIVKPVLNELEKQSLFYRGVLYIGLMITDKGPSVLEFNCRFGDPEAQVILPLLKGDLGELFYQVAQGQVPHVKTQDQFAAGVVLAAPGYPEKPMKGLKIEGPIMMMSEESYVIHAGTDYRDQQWVTNGGRVLTIMGLGKSLELALNHAYTLAQKITWPDLIKRNDIGRSALKRKKVT